MANADDQLAQAMANFHISSLQDIQDQINTLSLMGEHNVRVAEVDYILDQINSHVPPIPVEHPFRIALNNLKDKITSGQPMRVDEEYHPHMVFPDLPLILRLRLQAAQANAIMLGPTKLHQALGNLAMVHHKMGPILRDSYAAQLVGNRDGVFSAVVTGNELLDTAFAIKNQIEELTMHSRDIILMNQVELVISQMKKMYSFARSMLLRIDGFSEAVVLAVSRSELKTAEPFDFAHINYTGNLWGFLRDIPVRDLIELMSQNKDAETNILTGMFSDSLMQAESANVQYQGPGGNIEDLSLGRYGVVVHNINFIPGQDIVEAYRTYHIFDPDSRILPPRVAEAFTATPIWLQRRPVPSVGEPIPIGGLYFNCRIVDLQTRNMAGPTNLPAGPLLSVGNYNLDQVNNEPASYAASTLVGRTRSLPSVTMIRGLHLTIHGAPHPNQAHIKFKLGKYIPTEGGERKFAKFDFTIQFVLVPFVNNDGELVEKIVITNVNGDSALHISHNIALVIMNRYISTYDPSVPPPQFLQGELRQLHHDDTDQNIVTNPIFNEHIKYIRNAFYHFLLGIENYLSNLRNRDPVKPLDATRIMLSLKQTHQSDVDYKKYLKYKNKYLQLKKLLNKNNQKL